MMVAHSIRNSYLVVYLVAFLFTSCGNEVFIDNDVTNENSSWDVKDKYVLTFEQTDTVSNYNFFITLRNTENYPYRNIYVFLTTVFPDGKSIRDTIDCPLANYQGKWLGKGFGGIYDNRIIYMHKSRFPLPGEYKIVMEQAMRIEELPGITNVGIRIEKAL